MIKKINVSIFLLVAGVIIIIPALAFSLFFSPADALQGQTVRIMYIHVPFAYLSTLIYTFMSLASVLFLWKRYPKADHFANSCAYAGFFVTVVTLITGSIWGKPAWGVWWVWDARLTSVLVMSLMYFSIILIRKSLIANAADASAIFSIVGAALVPVVKLSVVWWNTLHQPPSLARGAIDNAFLIPLSIMSLSLTCIVFGLIFLMAEYFSLRQKISELRLDYDIALKTKQHRKT